MRAQPHSSGGPRVEVVSGGDDSAGALGSADGPDLVEGRRTDDGGLVHAQGLVDVVRSPVGGDGAQLFRGASGRVISAEGLNDVVLDEGIGDPTVDGKVAVAAGVVGTSVGDRSRLQNLVILMLRFSDPKRARSIWGLSYLADPGFQPFPPNQLPPVSQVTV